MHIIAGLGNPGSKYEKNRHNVGFMAADAIFRRHSFSPWRKKFKAEIAEGTVGGKKLLLIKPQTFMNKSGEAVGEAMRFYKLSPADITVLYDELDLAPGKIRVKRGGGSGGHNGIRSLDDHCGKDYRRVRIGIGHPGHKDRVHSHVLGDFAKTDGEWLELLLEAMADNIGELVTGDESTFMNRVTVATGGTAMVKEKPSKAKSGGQSHIRQARGNTAPKIDIPKTGPMAEMLKKLFGK